MKLQINKASTKGLRKKQNQNNEDWIQKYNTINLDCMMKLKPIKVFQKDHEKKIEIKRIRNKLKKYMSN